MLRCRVKELESLQAGLRSAKDASDRTSEDPSAAESWSFYRLLAENSKDVIWTSDWDFHWTYVSPSMERLRGFTTAETMAQGIDEVMTPASVASARNTLRETLAAAQRDPSILDQSRTLEVEYYCKWGGTVCVEVCATFLRDKGGNPIGIFGISRDISDRKRAEAAIRTSERRYRALADVTSDWVWEVNDRSIYTWVGPRVRDLLGYEPEEIVGKTPFDFMHPEEAKRVGDLFASIANRRVPFKGLENAVLHKGGYLVIVETSGTPVIDDQGNWVGYQGCNRDITDRKRAERELKEYAATLEVVNHDLESLYNAAEDATRAKSDFLANMSHEIRTPMTAILGYTEILQERLERREDAEIAETIHRNGEYLLRLVNDILDLSKIEAGRMHVDLSDCLLRRILSDVISLVQIRAAGKGLELEVEFLGEVPETIRTDPTRLHQILLNLLGNAIKFTEMGKVRVEVGLCEVSDQHATMQFDIIDTGVGIAADQMTQIFEPFSQGDPSTTRRFGGTGLGLTISRRLAEMLGGNIQVSSVLGVGSTFGLTVDVGPLRNVRMIAPSELRVLQSEVDRQPKGAETTLPCRLLLAEDGPDNQRLLLLLLKKAGAEVVLAENGQAAVELVMAARRNDQDYDAVLMDMQMPVMDGYDATRHLREEGFAGPIIALTAHAMTGDREKCVQAGCDDYVSKPIDRAALLRTIANHLDRKVRSNYVAKGSAPRDASG